LRPELLHRVIETCGLEDCADLVALATPAQLQRVFDLDLWRAARPGLDEHFDPQRFAVWLEVLMESGGAVAAEKLIGVDIDLVIASMAHHVLVMDYAAVAPFRTLEGEWAAPYERPADRLVRVIGGYHIEAKHTDAWDALIDLLVFLAEEHPDYFHRLMAGCRALSSSRPEADGFHDLLDEADQDLFDLTVDRERRREQQGYVTAPQARAFLQSAREIQLGAEAPPPAPNPMAHAYFRTMDSPAEADPPPDSTSPPPASDAPDSVDAVFDVLRDAGVLTPQPRALLAGPQDSAPRLARLHAAMSEAYERDAAEYSRRTEELAYLANTLLAGCSVQARPFTAQEASDAAAAVCNLGLENWPETWPPEIDGLIGVFQVGWRVLYSNVCVFAADRLVAILSDLRCSDRDIQSGLGALRIELIRQCRAGTPWRASDALDVIAILDMPAWAALLGLIDECPVEHAAIKALRGSGLRSFSASSFEFISENSQIASIHAFIESLPGILRG
jgi:hypothetical protein